MHRNAIYDEGAYEAAIARRIRANARIGRERRWLAEDPSRAALAEQIRQLGYDKGGFFASLSQSLSEWGSLSPAQEAAARNAIEKGAERRAALVAADAGSEWIGEVGERQDFRLRLSGLAEFEGAYGAVYLHFLKDEAGNVAIYKGGKRLGFEKVEKAIRNVFVGSSGDKHGYADREFEVKSFEALEKGEWIEIKASVKAHEIREGVKQSILARPKVKEA